MRILIVFYSYTGNNRLIARHLAERLGADMIEVKEPRQRTGFTILLDLVLMRAWRALPVQAKPQDYDHLLFLGPI